MAAADAWGLGEGLLATKSGHERSHERSHVPGCPGRDFGGAGCGTSDRGGQALIRSWAGEFAE